MIVFPPAAPKVLGPVVAAADVTYSYFGADPPSRQFGSSGWLAWPVKGVGGETHRLPRATSVACLGTAHANLSSWSQPGARAGRGRDGRAHRGR